MKWSRYKQSARVVEAFRQMDQDGSGDLDEHELDKALVSMDLQLRPWELKLIMAFMDTDGCGALFAFVYTASIVYF